jgi:Platelet-activating factor acetylhydrolase, isoform II
LSSIQDGSVKSDAHDNAQLRQTRKPFPLLLFSPGLGRSPFDYSIQLEELASHGYVVAAVEHIRDTFAVVLPDGHVVPFEGQLWGRYASPSEPKTIKFYEESAVVWAQDLLFAMENLAKLASMRGSPFFEAIDTGHVGAFGHSHGGRAAATACMLDARIRSCLNEDGRLDETQLQRPYWPVPGHPFKGAFAMLDWFDPGLEQEDYIGMHTTAVDYARDRLKSTGASLDAYLSPGGGSYHVTILRGGMRHTAFTDLPWLTATSPANRARYAEYLEIIRSTVLTFFEYTVRGNEGHGFACDSLNAQALVQCYGPIQKR